MANNAIPFIALAALILGAQPAYAECLSIEVFAKQLLAQFKEVPVVRAVQDGRPVIFFANAETGTYTVVAIIKSPMACTIGAGTSWLVAEVRPGGSPL